MKYSGANLPKIVRTFLKYRLPERISEINMRLLGGSLAQSTWKRYGAALSKWRSFASSRGKFWKEISKKGRGDFIGWCKERGNITANSVKIYLGALEGLTNLKAQLIDGGGEKF
jgi:hypothetical protein